MKLTFQLILTLLFITPVIGAKIMILSVLGSRSTAHNLQFIGQELAERGHQITFVFLEGTKIVSHPNISYVLQTVPSNGADDEFSVTYFDKDFLDVFPVTWYFLMKMLLDQCNYLYQTPNVAEILQYKGQLDLVVFDGLLQDCFLPVVHTLDAPVVFYHGNVLETTASYYLNIPSPYSSVRGYFRQYRPLDFKERILNFIVLQMAHFIHRRILYPGVDEIAKHLIPNNPGVHNIIRNASLYMGLADTVWGAPRPLNQIAIDIGCSHCRPAKPLPQEFRKLIDESGEHGFIVFAMGTYFDPKHFPAAYMEEIFTAFSRLNQTIIWKHSPKDDSTLPSNVKTFPWIPQQDLIGHPKARLCISHGGMYSLLETVYHGIPVLGIPIFGDQEENLKAIRQKGSALYINKFHISADLLYEKITLLLTDPSYKQNAQKFSERLQDQPETPLQRTLYWLEYVIRHKGASHLKEANVDISLFEYYCLDIILTLTLTIGVAVTLIAYCIKKVLIRKKS